MVGSWEVALVVAKWCVLLATAGAVGGPFVLTLVRKQRLGNEDALYTYLRNCAFGGLAATVLMLLVQIGAINRSGLGGMFDTTIGSIVLQSGVGAAAKARLLGFALLAAFTLRPVARRFRPFAESCVHAALAFILVASFIYTGHVSTLPGGARFVLALHVLAVCAWIGSLQPLLRLSATVETTRLQLLMRSFGTQAFWILALLIAAGVYLAMELLDAPSQLLTTPYGRVLLLKLFGVYALLMFAATNKWLLVPRLASQGSALALEKSIRMEWIIALLVLAVTSWLTTNVGPEGP